MLDTLYKETVTLRRPKLGSLGVGGQPELERVLDVDETELRISCRIQGKSRKVIDSRGQEVRSDATLVYQVKGKFRIQQEDFVVRSDRTAWKVIDVEQEQALFGGGTYGRVALLKTDRTFPLDKDTYA